MTVRPDVVERLSQFFAGLLPGRFPILSSMADVMTSGVGACRRTRRRPEGARRGPAMITLRGLERVEAAVLRPITSQRYDAFVDRAVAAYADGLTSSTVLAAEPARALYDRLGYVVMTESLQREL
jgi:hypothetical protein